MNLDEATRALLNASHQSREHYIAEVTRVLSAYGDKKWDEACSSSVRVLREGGTVCGFSLGLPRAAR